MRCDLSLCPYRQVDQRHGENVRGAYLEANLLVGHALVRPRPSVGLALDLLPDSLEVGEYLPRPVQELAPLRRWTQTSSAPLMVMHGGRLVERRVHELKHQRAARAYLGAAREEIATHEGFEHRGLAAGLTADDRYLRKLEVATDVLDASLREDVLQFVYEGHEAVAQRVLVAGHE